MDFLMECAAQPLFSVAILAGQPWYRIAVVMHTKATSVLQMSCVYVLTAARLDPFWNN